MTELLRLAEAVQEVIGLRLIGAKDADLVTDGRIHQFLEGRVEFEIVGAGGAQLVFKCVDGVDLEKLVLGAPMTHQRSFDLAGIDVRQRRTAVPDHARVDLG